MATSATMTKKLDRLAALQKKQEQIKQRIADIERKQKGKTRKEDDREKILIGVAYLADIELHPDAKKQVTEVLKRAITTKRDRDFLASRGWF
jgi:hypothetical protein